MTTIKEQYKEQDDERRILRKESEIRMAKISLPLAKESLKINEDYLIKLQTWNSQNDEIIKLTVKTQKLIRYYQKRIESLEIILND